MSKHDGFRTLFDAKSNSASILKKDRLEKEDSNGSISYEIFGASQRGNNAINTNNLYLNGIYMKAFNYSTYSKGIKINSENALFAIAEGNSGMDGALKVVQSVDGIREDICKQTNKSSEFYISNVLNMVHEEMKHENALMGKNDAAAVGGIYVTRLGASVFSMGGIGILRYRNNELELINDISSKGMIGDFSQKINLSFKNYSTKAGDESFLICSKAIIDVIPISVIKQIIEEKTPEEAVKYLISQASAMCGDTELAAVMVSVTRTGVINKKKILTAVCALVAVIALGIGATAMICEHEEIKPGESAASVSEYKINSRLDAILDARETDLEEYKAQIVVFEERLLMNSAKSTLPEYQTAVSILDELKNAVNDFSSIFENDIPDKKSSVSDKEALISSYDINKTKVETSISDSENAFTALDNAILPVATQKPVEVKKGQSATKQTEKNNAESSKQNNKQESKQQSPVSNPANQQQPRSVQPPAQSAAKPESPKTESAPPPPPPAQESNSNAGNSTGNKFSVSQ